MIHNLLAITPWLREGHEEKGRQIKDTNKSIGPICQKVRTRVLKNIDYYFLVNSKNVLNCERFSKNW